MSKPSLSRHVIPRIGVVLAASGALALALLAGPGCYYASDPAGVGGGDGGSIASNEFPCEAAKVLATCWACHQTPPRGGATFSLDKRSDLLAPSTVAPAQTMAERSLIRLRQASNPMPPAGYPKPTAAEVTDFANWIAGGMPTGTCAGTDPTQPAPTVCTSGSKWQGGNSENPDMNPGRPCRACHLGSEPQKAYYFSGTVYPTLHEQDYCNAAGIPAGSKVQILDGSGAVRVTMTVQASGNFYSPSTAAGFTLPYTAQVVTPSGSKMVMTTKQTDGDCNGCHNEQGALGATGRILIPTP